MRTRSGPRWYSSKRAYYTTINGMTHCLGKFAEDNATNRALAREEYHRLEATVASQVVGDTEPVQNLLARWLAHVEQNRRPKTFRTWHFVLRHFVKKSGHIAVCDLKPRHVSEFLDTKSKWQNGTRRMLIAALKAA